MQTIQQAKRELREQVRVALQGLGQGARVEASTKARERLKGQVLWQQAQSIMAFAPLPGELDVWPLVAETLATGRKVALPRFCPGGTAYEACWVQDLEQDIQVGRFGIREPGAGSARLAGERLDLVLVPGVAFDLAGRRLGRGKGYYDRLLAELQERAGRENLVSDSDCPGNSPERGLAGTPALPVMCAVAFDEQIVEEVPVEQHDVRMDFILTPTRWARLNS